MAEKAAKPLETFVWEGSNKQGARVKGEAKGVSPALVKADLRRQGINPLKVGKKPAPLFGGRSKKKITPKDIAVLSRQLSTMISAGVPLVQAFEIVGRGHENLAMQELILAIKADVESGSSLAEAMEKHPRQFDELYCNLVRAGEQAGILESLMNKIATYKEKTEAIKGKIKKALFYPTAVLVVAFIITAILLIFVIPQFESLFKGFGADLPALTQMVINLSAIFQKWWWLIFGALGGGVYAIIEAKKRSRAVAHFFDRVMLKVPVIGAILNKGAIARFARTMSTMFAAGVPLVESMVSVAGASGNVVYSDAILRMRDEVATGTQMNVAMRNTQLFPNMVVQMVAIGEEAGSLDAMLGKVADFYEEEVDNMVDSLSSLLEPMIMAILGVLVGGLVIAMYLPIFKMGSVV
ncbi:MAG: type II secretion system F family protein [Gammaproteobacteria bacterium]|nr:MAG: type II secretion system F family protein [Gammaproteobacteria bacterium]